MRPTLTSGDFQGGQTARPFKPPAGRLWLMGPSPTTARPPAAPFLVSKGRLCEILADDGCVGLSCSSYWH